MIGKMKEPTEVIPPPPMKDSADFSEEEAKTAEVAPDSQRMLEQLGHLFCRSCMKRLEAKSHALRRLNGIHYSRATLVCSNGHQETRVFRLDWLK
jgi:hypothetical protein